MRRRLRRRRRRHRRHARAARASRSCVLEAGGYFNESDFNQLELWAYQNLYWRGGPHADRRPERHAPGRRVPRRRHGHQLDELAAHQAVGARAVGARARARGRRRPGVRPPPRRGLRAPVGQRPLLGPQRPAAADAGGRRRARLVASRRSSATPTPSATTRRPPATSASATSRAPSSRRCRPTCRTPSTRGADIVVRCFAERVLVEGGRAAGVEGTWTDPETGRAARVTVRAPQVVVAAGALESPALLLRSRHRRPGGRQLPAPAPVHRAVRHLRRGPAGLVGRAARRPRRRVRRRRGRLRLPASRARSTRRRSVGSALPFTSAARAQGDDGEASATAATFIGLLRDHGHGRVTLDERRAGGPVLLAHRRARRAQHAPRDRRAGPPARTRPARARSSRSPPALPRGAGRRPRRVHRALAARPAARRAACGCSRAHQMGTCRMGTDPTTSVADPWGELHDTPGVWIGDAQRVPDVLGHQPDDHDHGAGPPHRRGDRRRRRRAGRGRRSSKPPHR